MHFKIEINEAYTFGIDGFRSLCLLTPAGSLWLEKYPRPPGAPWFERGRNPLAFRWGYTVRLGTCWVVLTLTPKTTATTA